MSEVEPIPGLRELVLGVPCLYVLVWIWVSMLKERTGSRAASIAVSIMNAPIYIFGYTALAVGFVFGAVYAAFMLAVFWPVILAVVVLAVLGLGVWWVYDELFDQGGAAAQRRRLNHYRQVLLLEQERKRAALAESDTEIRTRQQAVAAG